MEFKAYTKFSKFKDNFFSPFVSEDVTSTVIKGFNFDHLPLNDYNEGIYTDIRMTSSLERDYQTLYRIHLTEFISDFGALALSVMKGAQFIMASCSRFF